MSALPEEATLRSIRTRRTRTITREHVARGGSLAILLREERPELESVPIDRLVRWLPMVGSFKARRMLAGLPANYRLSMLDPADRLELTHRIATHERSRLKENANG